MMLVVRTTMVVMMSSSSLHVMPRRALLRSKIHSKLRTWWLRRQQL